MNKLDNGQDVVVGAVGKEIAGIGLIGDQLRLAFTDGSGIRLFDDGQSCCESRYLTTDGDDLSYYEGARLRGVSVEDGPATSDSRWDDVHEVQFLHVTTDRGTFVLSSHNEHNGYYGGIRLVAEREGAA